MGRTQTKGIRLTEAEVARARALAPLHPAASSEAELLRVIFVRGLLVEEAGLAATGVVPMGMTEAQLAAGVLAPVLAALQFLNRVMALAAPGWRWRGRLKWSKGWTRQRRKMSAGSAGRSCKGTHATFQDTQDEGRRSRPHPSSFILHPAPAL